MTIFMYVSRFRYNGFAMSRANALDIEQRKLDERRSVSSDVSPAPGSESLHAHEDAVSTIMQWLYGRLEVVQ